MVFTSKKDRDWPTATRVGRVGILVVLGGFEIEDLPLAADRIFSLPPVQDNKEKPAVYYPGISGL